jgi:hypothetical protein
MGVFGVHFFLDVLFQPLTRRVRQGVEQHRPPRIFISDIPEAFNSSVFVTLRLANKL